MAFLIESHCFKCGVIGESRLTWAGPHLKQSCDNCGFYQQFIDKKSIPDKREIKIAIWALTNDLQLIAQCKKDCGFVENLTKLDEKLQYYKLYKAVAAKIQK